jgi:hypothetical protein
MKTQYYIVSKYIVLPGLHSWPSAYLESVHVDYNEAAEAIHGYKNIDRIQGDNREYLTTNDRSEAMAFINETNFAHDKAINEWRHEVFGEPLQTDEELWMSVAVTTDGFFKKSEQ